MIRIHQVPTAILLLASLAATAAGADPPALDLAALTKASAQTMARLDKTPASWTAANTLASGAVLSVSVLQSGEKSRTTVHLAVGPQRMEMLRIIIRDGLWYVNDPKGAYKYRPYEYPAPLDILYTCLERSEPRFITGEAALADAKLDSVVGTTATYREPLSPESARWLDSSIRALEASGQDGRLSDEQKQKLAEQKDRLASGLTKCVNTVTGQLIEFGGAKLRTRINDFQFLDAVDEREFDVGGGPRLDYSDDPTAGDLNDLVMIGHDPNVRPGAKPGHSLDGQLLDVKTGRFRRIPFDGGGVIPGCFMKDRRYVIVGGKDLHTGSLAPFRIDLKTGNAQRLGGEALQAGMTIVGDLSPDGQTLAVARLVPLKNAVGFQIYLINVNTGDARPLGEPMERGDVIWTADGRHLVLVVLKPKGADSPPESWLASMDMEGKVIMLRPGDVPTMLADRTAILFKDQATELWQTCDLKGQNVKLFGDGLKGYLFPAVAPDGKRILMMKDEPGELPKPLVLTVGESSGRSIPVPAGLWSLPAWR